MILRHLLRPLKPLRQFFQNMLSQLKRLMRKDRLSQGQHGSVLIISLLTLSLLAGLSLSSMQSVVLESKLVSQSSDQNLAKAAAQYAVSEAKRLLLNNWSPGASTCPSVSGCTATNGLAVWSQSAFSGSTDFSLLGPSFFNSNAQATAKAPNPSVVANPRFFVIDLGCNGISNQHVYRIISIGFGATTSTIAYAEGTLTIPLSDQNTVQNAIATHVNPTSVYPFTVTLPEPNNWVPGNANPNPYTLYPSVATDITTSNNFFGGGSANACPQGAGATGAICELNCAGSVRVKGYSHSSNADCPWVYGAWADMSGGNAINSSYSQITLQDVSGVSTLLACGPEAPTCAGGQSWQGPVYGCACPAGQGLMNGSCVSCSGGTISNNVCTCNASTPKWNGTQCVACQSNSTWNSSSKSCVCNSGYHMNTSNTCVTCQSNSTWSSSSNSCVCNSGYNLNTSSNTCVSCSGGRVWNSGSNSCECTGGRTWTSGSCQCDSDSVWQSGSCQACGDWLTMADPTTWNSAWQCPSSTQQIECQTGPSGNCDLWFARCCPK